MSKASNDNCVKSFVIKIQLKADEFSWVKMQTFLLVFALKLVDLGKRYHFPVHYNVNTDEKSIGR